MDWMHILAAGSLVLTGLALAWLWAPRLRPPAALRELRTWAAAGGWRPRGDGRSTPMEVVGTRAGRLFTVGYQLGPPDVMMVAVDCNADGEACLADNVRLSDAALVSRWVDPSHEHVRSLDTVLDAMVQAAEAVEAEGTPAFDE